MSANASIWEGVEQGDAALVAESLRRGADPHLRSRRGGLSPWEHVNELGMAGCVRAFIDSGRVKADAGALRRAVRGGHAELVELLLAAGADANAADRGGRTALDAAREVFDTTPMRSVRELYARIGRALLAVGARAGDGGPLPADYFDAEAGANKGGGGAAEA